MKLSSDLSAYPQRPESFINSKAALRNLKEYLVSLRGSSPIVILLGLKREPLLKYINSKLSQLELFCTIQVMKEFSVAQVHANIENGSVFLLISDDDELLQGLSGEYSNLGVIQIASSVGDKSTEKAKGAISKIRVRVPIRLAVFYKTIQEVLLMIIYRQAINVVAAEPSVIPTPPASALTSPATISIPQYTPTDEPEKISEKFPLSILVVDDDNISKTVNQSYHPKLHFLDFYQVFEQVWLRVTSIQCS